MNISINFVKVLLIVNLVGLTNLHSPQHVTNVQRTSVQDKNVNVCLNRPQNGTKFDPKAERLADDEIASLTKALPYTKPRNHELPNNGGCFENPFRAIKTFLPMQDVDGNRTYEYIGCACAKSMLQAITEDINHKTHYKYFPEPASLVIFSHGMYTSLPVGTCKKYHAYMCRSLFEFVYVGSFYAKTMPAHTFINDEVIISEEIYQSLYAYKLLYQPTQNVLATLSTEELKFEPLAIRRLKVRNSQNGRGKL